MRACRTSRISTIRPRASSSTRRESGASPRPSTPLEKESAASRLEMARVMADMIALRTAAIDAAVRDAIADGATQLVILGAGYDGRAWRMPELAGVKVFEVDHPATQGDKRAHVAELPPAIGSVSFVPIDFERESLDAVAGPRRTRSLVANLLDLGRRRHVPHARRDARHARRHRAAGARPDRR